MDLDIRFPVPLERLAATSPACTANRAVNAVPFVCAAPPANRAVNAVPFVCAAPPGIRSTIDLPQIVARLG